MPQPRSLTVNDSRVTAGNLISFDAENETDLGASDYTAGWILAKYAATLRAKRRGAEVITLRLDHTSLSGRGVTESWTFQVTQGKHSELVGGYTNTFQYFLTITATEAETARTWLEAA